MLLTPWLRLLSRRIAFQLFGRRGRRRSARPATREARSLSFERLEDRTLLSTLTVNTNADDTTDDAVLTLREAILLVNAGGDANMALGRMLSVGEAAQIDNTNPFGTDDTILFDATAVNAANVITLGGTELSITSGLTITGNGSDSTYISANYASRLFNISGATFNVTFDGVTLQNGYIDSMSANGGGIASYAGGGRSRSRTAFSAGIGRSAAETSGGDCMPRISM